MKYTIFIILALINIRAFSQNEVSSIEEATNKELISVRNIIKPNKIILISYEYNFDKSLIRLSRNEYFNREEYNLKTIRKGEFFYLLKFLISTKREMIIVNTSLIKCTKKSNRKWIHTYFYDKSNEYLIKPYSDNI